MYFGAHSSTQCVGDIFLKVERPDPWFCAHGQCFGQIGANDENGDSIKKDENN